MQLTTFDRWLRRQFVYETHVKTLRSAESVPKGVREVSLPDEPGRRYKFLYVVRGSREADQFIAMLKEQNLMYSSTVVDRKAWYVKWISSEKSSFTWKITWIVIGGFCGFVTVRYFYNLLTDPEVQQMLRESWKTITR